MNELINNVATPGDVAAASADMRILLCMFVFAFILIVTCSLVVVIKNIGSVRL